MNAPRYNNARNNAPEVAASVITLRQSIGGRLGLGGAAGLGATVGLGFEAGGEIATGGGGAKGFLVACVKDGGVVFCLKLVFFKSRWGSVCIPSIFFFCEKT